ncbi:MAG: RNA polymerase subunit sigma [Bacteroidetes bacterium]|nr:RNA polymerase subunit sigma [Bacteroidota bacterium]
MNNQEMIPHLFRTEYRKIVSVLSKSFGFEYIEIAEDIVSDTFLLAAETWGLKGLPANPTAWLYHVSKNKAIDFIRRHKVFADKVITDLQSSVTHITEMDIDWSKKNIEDSQLQMMFAICDPCISAESQIGLSLNLLCGFGIEEIAAAFLTNKETIYKRLNRAKEKLRNEKVRIELPNKSEIKNRLENVLTTIYLLFSEGYHSSSQNQTLRREFCIEAMRLNLMLIENELTNSPAANALLSLMCFHASRFDARFNQQGEMVLYEDQDTKLWNNELIQRGEYYLNKAAVGSTINKYHLEAAIAYLYTQKIETQKQWEEVLQLYNKLLQIEYSPMAALNRTYALSKANTKQEAIIEAEKLQLFDNHLYHSLLGNLYMEIDPVKSKEHYETAYTLAKSEADKSFIKNVLEKFG